MCNNRLTCILQVRRLILLGELYKLRVRELYISTKFDVFRENDVTFSFIQHFINIRQIIF